MKVRKRMLISIILVFIMLLNCIAPIMQVQAEYTMTAMTFNLELYKGLKSFFERAGIDAEYDDSLKTIRMEASEISEIEGINLRETGISDLTGLDYFPNLKSLILSSNYLSESSNLKVLNNLPDLECLDLSSNQISDISEIYDLVLRLVEKDYTVIDLSRQSVRIVTDVVIDNNEQPTVRSYEIPQILQIAGQISNGTIMNKGALKYDWVKEMYCTSSNINNAYPYIDIDTVPSTVTSTNNKVNLIVGKEDNSGNYVAYEGAVKWIISIRDEEKDYYNTNTSLPNILKDCTFCLYYIVHTNDYECVSFNDKNFYYSVKEQLTKNQSVNKDLVSYKYKTDGNESVIYDFCDIEYDNSTKVATLKIEGVTQYTIEKFNSNGSDDNTIVKNAAGDVNPIQAYTVETVDSIEENGTIVKKLKVKIVHYNSDSTNLYTDAYDDAYTLIIPKDKISGRIPALTLNDRMIKDLSGLEKFIGLESNLNLSYNYIKDVNSIYELQENKKTNSAVILERYQNRLDTMKSTKTIIESQYKTSKEIVDEINKVQFKAIRDKIKEINELDTTAANYQTQKQNLLNQISDIANKVSGNEDSLMVTLNKILMDGSESLSSQIVKLYVRLGRMYDVFDREYKLTSLLTADLNYQTQEEYEALQEKMKTLNGAKTLATEEIAKISTLEQAKALSSLDKQLIAQAFGFDLSTESETPISDEFKALVDDLNDLEAPRSSWVTIINKMLEVDIYSQTANYCLIKRMNCDTAEGYCYVKEYLMSRIRTMEEEFIDTTIIKGIYNSVSTGVVSTELNSGVYEIFKNYILGSMPNGFPYCTGRYKEITGIEYETSGNEFDGYCSLGFSSINLICDLFTESGLQQNVTSIDAFDDLLCLANKFSVSPDIERFTKLPVLKSVDISNNEITSLEGIEKLSDVKTLYIGHNIISGDISGINWSVFKELKRLDLSYNFIIDIAPLQVLTNLRYLDVSDNLLSGRFDFDLKAMTGLKNINLSGNKFTDIERIITDYEILARGNLTDYFAREDTLNIDLSRQESEITIEEPILYSNKALYEIKLPPIFSQLEYIDSLRTSYLAINDKGTVASSKGTAYVSAADAGKHNVIISIIAANGYPDTVSTCIGINTICKINYYVVAPQVRAIKINESITSVAKGTTATFTATIIGTNVENTGIDWSIISNHAEGTTISPNGVLTVASDETATSLKIQAASKYDKNVKTQITIEVGGASTNKEVTGITISEQDKIVEKGKTYKYTANVTGNYLEANDKTVTWSIAGQSSTGSNVTLANGTVISNGGELTVSSNETAAKIIVTATSTFDSAKKATSVATISSTSSNLPGTLGYELDADDDVVGISPDTTCKGFKAKFISGDNLDVVVKRNGIEVADNDPIATGDIVSVMKNGELLMSNEMVIKGDINGDGTVTATDSMLIKSHRAKLVNLTGAYLKAADIDRDGEITISDVRLIMAHRARIDGYIL